MLELVPSETGHRELATSGDERGQFLASTGVLRHKDLKEIFLQGEGTGTFLGSVANLINAAIGAGVLGLPFAFQKTGAVLGVMLCIAFGLVTMYSLHIVGRVQQFTNAKSYQDCVGKLLGDQAGLAVLAMQIACFYMGGGGFLVIISDQLEMVLNVSRAAVIFIIGVLFLLPLMFIRNIQRLSPIATMSIVAIVYTLGMIVMRSISTIIRSPPTVVFGNPGVVPQHRTYDDFLFYLVFPFLFHLHFLVLFLLLLIFPSSSTTPPPPRTVPRVGGVLF